ncbi:hypothetical protein R6Q57_019895 [Mikania cordata]
MYAIINVLTGFGCLFSCANRTKMRRQYGLPEEPTNDCCVHLCCGPCALCQEYRELQHIGFDLSIGLISKAPSSSPSDLRLYLPSWLHSVVPDEEPMTIDQFHE